jgi:NADPH:quinone reductase
MQGNDCYRAVVCSALGPPEALSLQRLPRAPLVPGSARVRLHFCGVNFPDTLMIAGKYQFKPPLPFVPGIEASGIVGEVAAGVGTLRPGDRVMATFRTGGYAGEAVVAAEHLVRLPAGFSLVEGAAFLVAHLTAYHALVTRASLEPGQILLVAGAGGGVGLAAVQLGKHLGARVLAAASSRPKLDAALASGADLAIDYSKEPLREAVAAATAGHGADVIFDPAGLAPDITLRCLAFGGRTLLVGFAGGEIPSYAANRVLLKGAALISVRAGEAGRQSPRLREREMAALLALAEAGVARPKVTAVHALEHFATAMRALMDRAAIGRIVLDAR